MATPVQTPNAPSTLSTIKAQSIGAVKPTAQEPAAIEKPQIQKNQQDPAVKLSLNNAAESKKTASAYAPPTRPVATAAPAESTLKTLNLQEAAVAFSVSEVGLKGQNANQVNANTPVIGPSTRVLTASVNAAGSKAPIEASKQDNKQDINRMLSEVRIQIAEAPKKALEAQSNQKPQNVLSLLE